MAVSAHPVPPDSLLAKFGEETDYRDCFAKDVPGSVTLEEYIERFYCSAVFRPERMILGLMGSGASNEDARALARGDADRIAAWKLVERRDAPRSSSEAVAQARSEILLHSKDTGTASWLAVEPAGQQTRLLFGSWVGKPERPVMLVLFRLHRLYSRILLGGV